MQKVMTFTPEIPRGTTTHRVIGQISISHMLAKDFAQQMTRGVAELERCTQSRICRNRSAYPRQLYQRQMSTNNSEIIFSVGCRADIALREYFLDDRQRQHILLGHRGLYNAMIAIQSAVEAPTHIYRSKSDDNRLIFVSHEVITGRGHPMKVIVERVDDKGKIITATWGSKNSTEELVWEFSGALYSNYDKMHDVLYISKGITAAEYSEDDTEYASLWLRRNEENDEPQGVTVFGLGKMSDIDRNVIVDRISSFLGVTRDAVRLRANSAIRA